MKATLMVNVSLRFFDGRGRFVLPKIFRDKMNLRVGATVTIIDEGLPDYRLLSVVAGISEDDRKINISTISDLGLIQIAPEAFEVIKRNDTLDREVLYDGFGKNKCKKIILRATGCYLDI